jgi:hypothetical protein
MPKDVVLQVVLCLVLVGLVALFARFGGRIFARATIPWMLCFKFAGMVVVLLLVIPVLSAFLGANGPWWLGVLLVFATQVAVGAAYLGHSLGRVTGAKVGAGAALLGMGVSLILLAVLGALGLVRN